MSVSGIFDEFGEQKFRDAEKNTILELLEAKPCIIATGGGVLTNADTLEALKERSIMIWLDTDLETLWQRVQKSQARPLLQTENPRQKLEELMEARKSLYAQAHIHARLNNENAQKATDILIKALYEFMNNARV